MPKIRLTQSLIFCGLLAWAGVVSGDAVAADAGNDFFEAKIRPVLIRECYECHAADAKQIHGGLLLDHQAGLLKGGDSGAAVVPGKADESLLIGALRHEAFDMPPKGRLDDAVIADFVRWIEMGAPDPRSEVKTASSQAMSLAEAKDFWSFKPLMRAELPTVKQTQWPQNSLDYFVLSAIEAAGLNPVQPATKRQWIRRATFDLIGLPPTPQEIEAFLNDDSSLAYETVINRLLESPHYGERWGRHWLDVARYAEDQAHTFAVKPSDSGYRYRDWVIQALNDDMSFQDFVRLQIAADLLELNEADQFRHLPALGFFGLGAQYYKNSDAEKARADELDDRVDTLTRGFLGLTVSCARCHDHKYDPIPTQDYYSLAGVFQSCRLDDKPLVPRAEVEKYEASQQRLKAADDAVKGFIATEKQTASEAQATRMADYMMAAWRYQTTRIEPTPPTSTEIAAAAGLSELILKRWIDMFEPAKRAKHQALSPWFEAVDRAQAGDTSPDLANQLEPIAQSIQQQLVTALDIRAGRLTESSTDQPTVFEPGKPRYTSPMVTKQLGLVDIDVDLTGATQLYLVISDAGDGKSCDHANWIQPRLVGADGELKLSDIKWKSAQSGVGNISVNKNFSGQPLRVSGATFGDGLGTHAPSVIIYDLPPGIVRFKSRAGLDNSGTDQGGCGDQASVQYRIYTEQPNDLDLIEKGQVKPTHGVLSQTQTELVSMALSDKGLFTIADDVLEQILPTEKRDALAQRREELRLATESVGPKYPVAHVIAEAKPTDMPIFIRGNPARKGEVAPRRFLEVLAGDQRAVFAAGSGRRELAEAIVSEQNPLTARVIVNRLWQNHFGRGLVATASNFGSLGERPTHPELLDYLAFKFIDQGWSMKALHREIMLSATYRLSADDDAKNREIDPDNRLLWRMNRRRLDVEAWRDALLAVSEKLDRSLGGPSIDLDSSSNHRRTIYAKISRHNLNGLLRLFDFPDANITSERRSETTVPQQQLFVLNSQFMIQQSKAVAARFFSNSDQAVAEQIQNAFQSLYGRMANDAEIELGAAFLTNGSPVADQKLSRTEQYAQVLLGANEFVFVD